MQFNILLFCEICYKTEAAKINTGKRARKDNTVAKFAHLAPDTQTTAKFKFLEILCTIVHDDGGVGVGDEVDVRRLCWLRHRWPDECVMQVTFTSVSDLSAQIP
ncbi:PREDICTED: uncharacterized protein LOC108380835 [Rhagoletis zephyria]|uniref:uncharacterized protein LOC108380835 n=1 Tax=Rhagoletis zephyria TaxID=28612 RepID=UPI000811AA7D|nr:PREDICTED: uncharacterized protein LOC108380835 [Rhagoletis zephyria]